MTVNQLIDIVLSGVDNSWPTLHKIRYVYVSLGKLLRKNTDFFFSVDHKLGEQNLSADEIERIYTDDKSSGDLKVICRSAAYILQRAYDEISHDVARSNTPVVFCIDRAGIVADDGDTHQGIFDIAFLSTIPNITITMPSCIEEAQKLLELGMTKKYGPFVIRYPKSLLLNSQLNDFEYGSWQIIKPIQKVNIITYGSDVYGLYECLLKENLADSVGLINARFIKPYDEECLKNIMTESDKIIVYEQVIKDGSLGSKIKEFLYDKKYRRKFKHFCLNDTFLETGKVEELKKKYKIEYEQVIKEIKK